MHGCMEGVREGLGREGGREGGSTHKLFKSKATRGWRYHLEIKVINNV